jgi:hypothetical protein
MKSSIAGISFVISFTIIGCGGGGGSATPSPTQVATPAPVIDEDLGGVWFGTSTSDQGGPDQDLLVISTDDGRLRALSLSTGAQFVGTISTTGDDLVGSGVAVAPQGSTWSNNTSVTEVNLTGQLSERAVLASSWNTPATSESGTINIQYDSDIHTRVPSLDIFNGNWVTLQQITSESGFIKETGIIASVFTLSDGDLTGSDVTNCNYSGTIRPVNAIFNTYDVNVTVTNCGTSDGAYTGLGVLTDTLRTDNSIHTNAAFIFSVDNGVNYRTDAFLLNDV